MTIPSEKCPLSTCIALSENALEYIQQSINHINKLLKEPMISNAPDQARVLPSPEAGCSACFWNEGGRCYDEPCDRLPDGRSKKMADARCAHYITKREKMSRVIPGDMLVITSEQNAPFISQVPEVNPELFMILNNLKEIKKIIIQTYDIKKFDWAKCIHHGKK
jgi:hypothetical protein